MRGIPYIVPLAPQVMKILKMLYAYTGHQEWVFPHIRQKGKPMAKTALLAALRADSQKYEIRIALIPAPG